MKSRNQLGAIVASSVFLAFGIPAVADEEAATTDAIASEIADKAMIDAHADQVLSELLERSDRAKDLFDESVGYAVFDSAKAGLIITGGGGTGVAVNKATGDRVYMNMGTAGIGVGVGVQKFQLVVLFQTQEKLDDFIDGDWDSAVSAQAAAGKAGSNVASSFTDGVAMYQVTDKGLMAQADLTGTRFWVDDDLND